ncbi:hypothetical protein NE237_006321 [Protea cynaroides]|uniref:CAAX prenyl protease 2/Lysostaphin resistance protein A-like domain-containing protein n=1 Tax=Protea cynaroides TaxID=273540 RepID=A0A9Q0KM55_9MAGN|nr:hypothetical protein NE237_006321 [Protea cynaroides]
MVVVNCSWRSSGTSPFAGTYLSGGCAGCPGPKLNGLLPSQLTSPGILPRGFGATIKAMADRTSVKRLKRYGERKKPKTPPMNKKQEDSAECSGSADDRRSAFSRTEFSNNENDDSRDSHLASEDNVPVRPSRSAVLQACSVTSGLILLLGLVIRQASHVASMEGLPLLDCSTKVSFDFKVWHLELIIGLVALVSSCRHLLLKTWPDFAESSEAANQQVLGSLQSLDYIVVAFLPGVSEELLFRGALLPLFGLDWKSALIVAAIFGVLHLGGGRKSSFAIWATFVGFAYGYATIISSSIIVPMFWLTILSSITISMCPMLHWRIQCHGSTLAHPCKDQQHLWHIMA